MFGSEVMCSKKLYTPWSIYRKLTVTLFSFNLINIFFLILLMKSLMNWQRNGQKKGTKTDY